MKRLSCSFLVAVLLCIPGIVVTQRGPLLPAGRSAVALGVSDLPSLRSWDATIDRLVRDGSLQVTTTRPDPLMPTREHQRMRQMVDGIEVFGGDVTRQTDRGTTVGIYGNIYRFDALDLEPSLTPEAARARVEDTQKARTDGAPRLMILPTANGSGTLVYRVAIVDPHAPRWVFANADSGVVELTVSTRYAQSAVGTGKGAHADTKKIGTTKIGGAFYAQDQLRPPSVYTYDARGSLARAEQLMRRTGPAATNEDLGKDADNTWDNPALVDAHAHLGYAYDYLFKRFGYEGFGDRNLRMQALVNPVTQADCVSRYGTETYGTYCANAFYWYGAGPNGAGIMMFGAGLPSNYYDPRSGQKVSNLAASLDIAAHEFAHGITAYSSDLVYKDEPGALNEAFSDIIGFGVEAFMQERGSGLNKADWLHGEDAFISYSSGRDGSRSMADPLAYGDPDHYSRRVYIGSTYDEGGVHFNSSIANHAFYLAVEGGTNRTSGMSVTGVGWDNREQIEKAFFRAFVFMLPSNADFFVARQATIQAAEELYGSGSAAAKAITAAWDAVGVRRGASISYSFSSDPVPPASGRCNQPNPNFAFTVTATETSGIGFEVDRATIHFFTASGAPWGEDDIPFSEYFDGCSAPGTRIGPNAKACSNLCVYLGGASGGHVSFTLTGVDDRGTLLSFSSPLLRLGTVSTGGPSAPASAGACTVDVQK